jgi:hypothetical protein
MIRHTINHIPNYSTLMIFIIMCIGTFSFMEKTHAQDDYSNVNISDLFKNPKKIKWVKHYKGRVDDISDVGLSVAYDGKNCKGFITYLRSKERFKLEGHIKKSKLLLRETDNEESVTGHFEGDIKNDFSEIKAHWFNKEKTRAGVLDLKRVEKEVIFPTYCGDNKWIRKYQGFINSEKAELILQRSSDYKLKGVLWLKNRNRTYSLEGTMLDDMKFKVIAIDDTADKIGTIEGEINPSSHKLMGSWINAEEKSKRVSFHKIDNILVGCIEYQDYMTTYDVTYPKSKNEAFNSYMDLTVEKWKNSCQKHAAELKKINPVPGPEDRGLANAAGWFELEYFSDTLISGYITFNKSWEDDHQDISFNYDLVKGRSFTLYDLFKTGVDYNSLLREKVLQKLQFASVYGNKKYKEWLNEASFVLFTIRENGIRYSTSFHPIYGRQSATIPFSDIEKHLNPYSSIAYLYMDDVPQVEKRRRRTNK